MDLKILLIDDQPEVLATLGRLLKQKYEIDTACDAEEALILCQESGPYAIVLADYGLPGMDGIEFLSIVQDRWPESVRMVITGVTDFDLAVKAVHEGQIFRFMTKPCEFGELCQAIDEGLGIYQQGIEDTELTEQLALAKDSLKTLTEDLEDRIAIQMSTLQVLHRFAVCLNASECLDEMATLCADATFEALDGHGVHVQLWDDTVGTGTIEASAGPEMSSNMHREPLDTSEGQVGEIVVDMIGADRRKLTNHDREVLAMIAAPAAVAARNEFRRRERDAAQHSTILALARLSEQRDNETGKHIERVSLYCELTANGLREDGHYTDVITDEFIDDLVRSAPLHDIGKVGIPDSILLKPGKLTPSEWEIMKTHSEIGAHTLNDVIKVNKNPGFLEMGRDIAWCHHEKWDGSGYPRGISGEDIPLSARILAIADIYDALTTERPYKQPWTHADAIEWLSGLGDNHLDPHVVTTFTKRADEADRIRARLADTAEDVMKKPEEQAYGSSLQLSD
jgi:response regulator RpfG family c-di-GMP phosphodiesterase